MGGIQVRADDRSDLRAEPHEARWLVAHVGGMDLEGKSDPGVAGDLGASRANTAPVVRPLPFDELRHAGGKG